MWQALVSLLSNLPLILRLIQEVQKLMASREAMAFLSELDKTLKEAKGANDAKTRQKVAARLSELAVELRRSKREP